LKKFLSILLCVALVAGVAVLSAGAIRSEAPAVVQAEDHGHGSVWWQGLPGWVQSILRYLLFGWIWMKQPVSDIEIYFPGNDGKGGAVVMQGETMQLAANTEPANAANKNVVWSVDCNASVATINPSTGLLEAKILDDKTWRDIHPGPQP